MTKELIAAVGKYALARGESWRLGAGSDLMDAYEAALSSIDDDAMKIARAATDVIAERERQKVVEGWTPEHDDMQSECELARAAACYAVNVNCGDLKIAGAVIWPWSRMWWKPSDYRRNLVKAAALLLAEIERVDRRNG